jgi:protein-tyrosine-phosphatase
VDSYGLQGATSFTIIEFIIPQSSGNICRSPMGEAVLQHIAKERGLEIKVDSAGTAGYHVGEEPDER